ncbi:PP2C family protein-serine/threonine phosphatase [Actinomycetospora chibensis]|uniref:PP2C family protein-serine/threonine phosphatase n=1 Tax=Actinomycetospora chibensis TaxID=663606 RepID=A0ABV9RMB9_9PSEU|nr:GAF domain-containing SpoIIE family protein phosphatase [Actinomycetospora chibensis]MDD7922317.1 SpoIIE family protein phosphatase [Actinomycetospora chibensis]
MREVDSVGGDVGEHPSPVPTTPPGPAEPFDRLTELACDVAAAPIALVSRLEDDGVRVWHAAPGTDAIDREVPVAETLCRLVADAQRPVVVPDADRASRDGESDAVLAVGIRAWAGFPIRDTDGAVLGSLTVVDTRSRPWTGEQVRRLAGIARAAGDEMALRADLAVSQRSADELAHRLQASDRAARASDRDARRAYDRAERADALATAARRQAGAAVELAETLQQSLTPQHPPRVPGMEIAARHRGPTDGHSYSGEVLGDFYDVFATPTGWGVVVGDVCGHGADAARTTALARSTARALGHSEPDPALVLTAVNGVLHDWFDTARSFVTAVYAQITDHDAPEPAGLTVQLAAAGHPPGVVWHPGGAVTELDGGGRVLGIRAEADVASQTIMLPPGAALVLHTDGVTEARAAGSREQFGEDRLRQALEALPAGAHADAVADAVLAAVDVHTDGHRDDDTLVLVVRSPGA